MATKEDIRAALGLLDTNNDAHWTNAGLPQVGAVEEAGGLETTRAEIEAAAEGFTRTSPAFGKDNAEAPPTSGEPGPSVRAEETPTSGAQTGRGPQEVPPTSGANVSGTRAGNRAEVEAELSEAQDALAKAQRRYNDAYRSMTAMLEREAGSGTTLAQTARAYQESQKKLRSGAVKQNAMIAEALRSAGR